jgi:hypothetical protein
MLQLIRDRCSPFGNLGYIDLRSDPEGFDRIFTLERPWVPAPAMASSLLEPAPCGRKGVSCIPPGIYSLVPHNSEAHPDTFALVNPDLWVYHYEADVPTWRKGYARTAVLIHPANLIEELRGCIAPGLSRDVESRPWVGSSRRAFALLRPYLKDAKQIEIVQL